MKKFLAVILITGLIFILGCANPQAENFTKQIMINPNAVNALIKLKAKDPMNAKTDEETEIWIRWVLMSGFQALGYSDDESLGFVEEYLKGGVTSQTQKKE